jgi:membrane fusion protein, multidrug efflux system
MRRKGTWRASARGVRPLRRRTLAFVAALGVALAAGCGREGGDASVPGGGPVAGRAPAPVEIEVQTVPVRRGAIVQRVEAPGSLVARRESKIGTEVQGRIARVFVDEGDRVEAGAELFQIDPEPHQMALRQAEAAADHAGAERHQVEVDLARARELHARQILSKQELDKLETALAVARAGERQAAEEVALARHRLERTLVRAPYAGFVAARLEDEGTTALVQPQTVVLVLQESGELEARAAIPESRLALVRIGDPALIHVEGLAAPIQTEVFAVSGAIDSATRTYIAKMRVPNTAGELKAGIFAEIEILPRSKRDALLVPREAIRSQDGATSVLTLRDGLATAVPVTLGFVSEREAEVLQGVRVDMPVIVGDAAAQLAEGMRVRAATAPGAAP